MKKCILLNQWKDLARLTGFSMNTVGAGCPEGYIATGGSCYRVVSEKNKFNFDEGAILCENSGEGHLLAIQSEAENYLIGSTFGKQNQKVALGSKFYF